MAAGRWSFGNGDGAQEETLTSSHSRGQPLGRQDYSAKDLAFAQPIQRLVGFSKRPRNHMAAYLPGGSHTENFPQVLPSADR
jgi:hypothetical protein